MTTPLSNDEKRVILSESLGWIVPDHCISKRRMRGEKESKLGGACPDFGHRTDRKFELGEWNETTNYFASLDACALLRRNLSDREREEFAQTLFSIVTRDPLPRDAFMIVSWAVAFTLEDATSEQICNAYAKVKALW